MGESKGVGKMNHHIQIEFTNYCQLSCVECPHRLMKREKKHMDDDVFHKILKDYIIPLKPTTIICHKDGEPFLHPKLFQFIEEIDKKIHTKFDIYTNGLLLRPWMNDVFSKLRSSVWILISFHFFDYTGKMVEYGKTMLNIEETIKNAPPNVEFVFVTHLTDFANRKVLEMWQDRMKLLIKKFPKLRDVHLNTAINPWAGLIEQKNCISFPSCPYLDGEHLFIGVAGDVIACCMDLEEEITFGNVMLEDCDHILMKRKNFYEALKKGFWKRPLCERCLTG